MKKWILIGTLLLGGTTLFASDLGEKEKLCQEGNATSCYEVGVVLSTGKNGENQDKKELGIEYIRKACKYSVNEACDALGEHYYKDKHYQAARPFMQMSCSRGVRSACEGVGTMYRDAQEIEQSDLKAREYYDKACDLKSGDACINIAIMYRGGFGVTINRVNEKAYYKKACDAGSEVGCNAFTRMDNKDKGIEEPGLWEKFKSLFN